MTSTFLFFSLFYIQYSIFCLFLWEINKSKICKQNYSNSKTTIIDCKEPLIAYQSKHKKKKVTEYNFGQHQTFSSFKLTSTFLFFSFFYIQYSAFFSLWGGDKQWPWSPTQLIKHITKNVCLAATYKNPNLVFHLLG